MNDRIGRMHVHYASFNNVADMNRAFSQVKAWAALHIAGDRHQLANKNLKAKPNNLGAYTGNHGESIAAMHIVNSHYNAWHCMGQSAFEPDGTNRITFHAAIRQFLNSEKGCLFAILRCHRSMSEDESDQIGLELSKIGARGRTIMRIPNSDANEYQHPGYIAEDAPLLIVVPCTNGNDPHPDAIKLAESMTDLASVAVVEHATMLSIARRIENPQAQHIWVTRPLILCADSPVSVGNYSIGELPLDEEACRQVLITKQNEIATDIMYSSTFFALKMAWDDAQLLCHTAPGRPEPPRTQENTRIRELERQVANAEQKLQAANAEIAKIKAQGTDHPPAPNPAPQTVLAIISDREAYGHVAPSPEFQRDVSGLLNVTEAHTIMDAMENLGRALENTPNGRVGNYTSYFRNMRKWSLTPPQSPDSPEPQEFQLTEPRPEGDVTITATRRLSGQISLLSISAAN